MTEDAAPAPSRRMRVTRLHLTNFLSYRRAVLELGDLVALVGPNASGKSNAVAAIKLLREIPSYGLPAAVNRRGGFDQLRHRSHGHPYDPAIRLDFQTAPGLPESHYEVSLRALSGKRYEVKSETAEVNEKYGTFSFSNLAGRFAAEDRFADNVERYPAARDFRLPPGQSAVNLAASYGSAIVGGILSGLQTVEINPARVADLQEPSSTLVFEPDGSNTASIYEDLPSGDRQELIDELAAIVPGIDRIEVRHLADKVTLSFGQHVGPGKRRESLAKQMSDGTLRAFSILLAMLQPSRSGLLVVEEPEIAIHLGALRTLVDILRQHAETTQILMTTHSADIVDTLDIDSLRVVWSADGSSHIAPVASPHPRTRAARAHNPRRAAALGLAQSCRRMTAAPGSPHIGIVVEGPGDGLALPVLLRLHLGLRDDYRDVLGKPVSCNGREKALMPNGLEGKIVVAAARPGCRAVMVVLDGEGDPVCVLGPQLLRRASAVSPRPVAVALADPTFEAWLCASAETLELDGLEYDPARDPGGALKEALKPRKYVKPTWQPRLAARMNIRLAAGRDGSLARALRKFDELLGRCR